MQNHRPEHEGHSVFYWGIMTYYVLAVGSVAASFTMLATNAAPQHNTALMGCIGFVLGRFSSLVSEKLISAQQASMAHHISSACRSIHRSIQASIGNSPANSSEEDAPPTEP